MTLNLLGQDQAMFSARVMNRSTRGVRLPVAASLLVACVFTMAITSCGGSATDAAADRADVDDGTEVGVGDEGGAGDAEPGTTADTPTGADEPADSDPENLDTDGDDADGRAEDPQDKSLADYLGVAAGFVRGQRGGGFGAGFDEESVIEEQRLIQTEIQACMQTQGFEYIPTDDSDGIRFFAAQLNQGLTPTEFAAQQGFGISTRFDAVLEGDVDFSEDADPNDEHVETLSEGEADAWEFALRGAPPERNAQGQLIDPETGEVLPRGAGRRGPQGGCQLEAQVAVRGDLSVLADLSDEFEELDERIAADPRVTEMRTEWAACMRDEGFDYDDEDAARESIQSEFFPLLFSFFGRGPGAGQQRGQSNPFADLELTDEQETQLDTLQDREIATAVASLVCAGDTGTELEEITARYEAQFVEDNRATLESIGG